MIPSLFRRAATSPIRQPYPERAAAAQPSLEALERDLVLFQAEFLGVQSHVGLFGSSPGAFALSRQQKRDLRDLIEESSTPCVLIDPRPGLRIVEANEAFGLATFTQRSCITGDKLFAALPGNMHEDNIASAFNAYKTCAQTCRPYTLPLQRYDMRDPAGNLLERHWHSTYLPILNDAGRLIYILNRPEPVTVPASR